MSLMNVTKTLQDMRILADMQEDKEHWLRVRKHFVTGTGVSAILGLSSWMKPSVVAQYAAMEDPPPFPVSRHMKWGSISEQFNGEVAANILRATVVTTNAFVGLSSEEAPIGASLDGLITFAEKGDWWEDLDILCSTKQPAIVRGYLEDHEGEVGVLELKNVGSYGQRKWKNGVPSNYAAQVQTQLLCTGLPFGVIVAKVGAADMFMHVIEADAFEQNEIVDAVNAFVEKYDLQEFIDGQPLDAPPERDHVDS